MPPEVAEFAQITDGEWPHPVTGRKPNEAELRGALQALLTRQCIYSYTPGLSRAYDLIRQYSPFFKNFYGSLGYNLVVSPRDQMVALQVPIGETRYDAMYERLRKDETIVLLALRLMWGEAISSQDIAEGGIYETTTSELIDRIKTITQQNPPSEARLDEMLRLFSRHGAVRTGEKDRIEKVSPITILPGIQILVPDGYVGDLLLWSTQPPEEDRDFKQLAEPDDDVDEDN
jgi:hypothetical protein